MTSVLVTLLPLLHWSLPWSDTHSLHRPPSAWHALPPLRILTQRHEPGQARAEVGEREGERERSEAPLHTHSIGHIERGSPLPTKSTARINVCVSSVLCSSCSGPHSKGGVCPFPCQLTPALPPPHRLRPTLYWNMRKASDASSSPSEQPAPPSPVPGV